MRRYFVPLSIVLERIDHSDDREIGDILGAIIKRFNRIHPDYELVFTSLHKEGDVRLQEIRRFYEYLIRQEAEAGRNTSEVLLQPNGRP